jgi:hypothetical protein
MNRYMQHVVEDIIIEAIKSLGDVGYPQINRLY